MYCSHKHYALAKRLTPERRQCANCPRTFLVGGTAREGRRRPDVRQRFHSKACASKARERNRHLRPAIGRLRRERRSALANAIDGEGWISKDRWVVEIGNTSLPWLAGLRHFAGEVGSIRAERRRVPRYRTMWRWRVYGINAYALLTQCLPDLVIKRARAQRLVDHYRDTHLAIRLA